MLVARLKEGGEWRAAEWLLVWTGLCLGEGENGEESQGHSVFVPVRWTGLASVQVHGLG